MNTLTPHNSKPVIPTQVFVNMLLATAQAMSEKTYFPYQKVYGARIVEAVLHHEGGDITALFSRQSGKTEVTGGIAAALAVMLPHLAKLYPDDWRFNYTLENGLYQGYKNGIKIGIYAPKQDQSGVAYRRMTKAFSSNVGLELMEELGVICDTSNRKNTVLSNGSSIWCDTASEKANVEGETFHLLILEECQDIDDFKIEKSLEPMVAFHGGVKIKVGTCNYHEGNFYRTIKKNIQDYREGRIARRKHFFFPHQVVEKYNPLYAHHVRQEIEKYGESSDPILLSYKCQWLFERGQFMTEDLLLNPKVALREGPFSRRWDSTPLKMLVNYEGETKEYVTVAAIDWGKIKDSTVVTVGAVCFDSPSYVGQINRDGIIKQVILYKKHILNWLEIVGDDYETQFWMIKNFLKKYRNLVRVVTDATTSQVIMTDRMAAEYDVEIVPMSLQPPVQSEMNKNFLSDITTARFTFPYGDSCRHSNEVVRFINQMLNVRKNYRNGYLLVANAESADLHDDYYDSAALLCSGCSTPINTRVVETIESNLFLR